MNDAMERLKETLDTLEEVLCSDPDDRTSEEAESFLERTRAWIEQRESDDKRLDEAVEKLNERQ